jgi:peptidoglycan/xylan/chitin deacetylase (PgdA/CDA1 family)
MSASISKKLLSPWLYTFRRYQRQWSKRAASQAWIAVLCYHRIVAKPSDNNGLYGVEQGLSAATFEAQMRFMRHHFMPISTAQVPEYQSRPGCYFAVTFDDGYADNFTVAAPILRQLGLSATFFVTSPNHNAHEASALFWWEQLAQMLRHTTLPELYIDTHFPEWTDQQWCPLNLPLTTHRSKLQSFQHISYALMRTPARELPSHLTRLAQALQIDRHQLRRELPLMDIQQLRQLQQQGFEIGGHTASHAHLGLANPDERQLEIVDATHRLNHLLERPMSCFAYPYGQPMHYNSDARADVIRSGYQAAFTTSKRLITAEDDVYTLPRIKLNQPYAFACAHTIEQAFMDTITFQNMTSQNTCEA